MDGVEGFASPDTARMPEWSYLGNDDGELSSEVTLHHSNLEIHSRLHHVRSGFSCSFRYPSSEIVPKMEYVLDQQGLAADFIHLLCSPFFSFTLLCAAYRHPCTIFSPPTLIPRIDMHLQWPRYSVRHLSMGIKTFFACS